MKVITIAGARPQFVKAATVSCAFLKAKINQSMTEVFEIIVHTGQHYDYNMSKVFFDDLNIPEPYYHLEVGSGSHGHMTGTMLTKIEDVLQRERPDVVLVYGDTNSTLAGSLAAAKLHFPVAHVEAGLRSFNKKMPEEINRLLTDHVSSFLFAPTETAVNNLKSESIVQGVVKSGDVMLDAYLMHKEKAASKSDILSKLNIDRNGYALATVHRQENTDDDRRLEAIFRAFDKIGANSHRILLPLHPRTRKALAEKGIDPKIYSGVQIIEPVGYLEMIQLEINADVILTDSGGMQKEAYFAGVPCVTLRNETEWVETVEAGVNFLAGAETDAIVKAYERALSVDVRLAEGLFGDGHAAEKIVETLISEC
jgi:UDP-N-acetylglucosamine 2-epimerase